MERSREGDRERERQREPDMQIESIDGKRAESYRERESDTD